MSCSFLSFNIVLHDGENEPSARGMRKHTQIFDQILELFCAPTLSDVPLYTLYSCTCTIEPYLQYKKIY
jgi:hypothetical protein